jgi:hypothetical protein
MMETKQSKRVAVSLPNETRDFLEKEAQETGVPLSNLLSYIAVNYVRAEKKKRSGSQVN